MGFVVVGSPEECVPDPGLCLVTSCPWNLRTVETARARGSRCGRALVGASQGEVAEALGISGSHLANIEAKARRKVRLAFAKLGVV